MFRLLSNFTIFLGDDYGEDEYEFLFVEVDAEKPRMVHYSFESTNDIYLETLYVVGPGLRATEAAEAEAFEMEIEELRGAESFYVTQNFCYY